MQKTEYRDMIQNEDDLAIFKNVLESCGLAFKWSGLCLWIETDPADFSAKQANAVLTCGARYSQKRDAYYIRSNGKVGKR